MVVVEEPSADSNERLKSSLEKGERLHKALWRVIGLHGAGHGLALDCISLRLLDV
jgi:hypothetical protein